ncbi:MAG: AAA family ATPase [Planctomycetota bacterium]
MKLTAQSDGDIKAILRRGGDASDAIDLLKATFKGTHARESHLDAVADRVTGARNPAAEWLAVLRELKRLADVPKEEGDAATLPDCPILRGSGMSEQILQRLAAKLCADDWLQLMLTSLNDRPEFDYRVTEDRYIPFQYASQGQQATALLTVLLNQEGGPLLIDQPEEDLDKAIVNQVVERIWAAKERRQLIFVSHDANIVVNGDAELVVHCAYASEGNRSAGRIADEGAIDQGAVRDTITRVMEGGKEAFNLRKEKYGF